MVRPIKTRQPKRAFRRDAPGGLWLPRPSLSTPKMHQFVSNIHLTIGYADATGGRSTWDGVEERLRRHALRPLVAVLCNIASFLEPSRDHADDPQVELLRNFL